ncbi:hypothetical protein N7449_004988 [Penicillium cf. viridicatum]|uniref:Uncharacterized protein n=1 Tax=Penicillium cf. viridicatum TaxID=2972119 RepID=A0A9W9SYL9_9EURO|nr:hypothetical protein N7449_004988 [Penicillium cf. viridicatum]
MGLYHRVSAFEHRERIASLWIEILASNPWADLDTMRMSMDEFWRGLVDCGVESVRSAIPVGAWPYTN